MAGEIRTDFRDDPDRTDVLPALEVVLDDEPTVVAASLESERERRDSTQPRLAALAADAGNAPLAAEREHALALGRELEDARATIAGLEERQARLVAELESLRQMMPSPDPIDVGTLRAELAQLQATVAEHDAERFGWREARDAAFADVQRLSTALATADASLATLRRELATTRGSLERARATLAERDGEIAALRAELGAGGTAVAGEAAVPTLIPLEGAPPGAVRLATRTRLGRAEDNELVLDAPSVSRHHAILISSARGVFVEDLNSVNGVYVNRRRVRQARLVDGDVVALGGVSFRYSGPAVVGVESDGPATRSE